MKADAGAALPCGRTSMAGGGPDFVKGNILPGASEVVIGRQEQHAVTFFALPHRNTGTIPVGGRHLSLFIFVVTAGAKGRAEFVLVLGKTFNHNGGHARINTEIGARPFGILFREMPHGFEALIRGLLGLSIWVHEGDRTTK